MPLRLSRKNFMVLFSAIPFLGHGRRAQAFEQSPDPVQGEEFMGRILSDTAAAMLSMGTYIGSELRLFDAMAAAGPVTLPELARRTSLNETYLRDWLALMVTGKYVDYQPAAATYRLPPAHASVLCDQNSPVFARGYIGFLSCMFPMQKVLDGFRGSKGPSAEDYPAQTYVGIEEQTRPIYRHVLTQRYLAAIPSVTNRLREGGAALDVGCGGGLASIGIAKAYPEAHTLGVDVYAPSIERARANAVSEHVADRARFELFDGKTAPTGPFDLITILVSIHHVASPVHLLTSLRSALRPGGSLVIMEANIAQGLEHNVNAWGNWLYGASFFYCTPATLSDGGPGYGAAITGSQICSLAKQAGFSKCRRVRIESQYDALYELLA